MTQALSQQAFFFLWAGAGGILLGMFYDFGRMFRRCFPKMTVPADCLFALCFFLCLMALSLYTAGLRLYQCLGLALGAAGYFLAFSSIFQKIFGRFWAAFRAMGCRHRRIMKKSLCFLRKIAKKFFPSSEKWVTILKRPFFPKRKSTPKGSAKPRDEKRSHQASRRTFGAGYGMESGAAFRRIETREPAAECAKGRRRRTGTDRIAVEK